ncbi:glycerophosphodiester phosphodiesterase [Nocardioides bizhenqiangii]|uniref:glycerophosphodiester phosphodiesterase n=1 Tax=Nocardioides bizhenqiangii TaxID=3095076 RepID=A0ABZ0ZVM1_9ACTN|nr:MULTISPECIES: glycerophosphodiester phosphodiesterase [unclassified Nocardioides]MDZ5623367.1 glycerophosphodiester phosphodiesterase [Nocardioides sp. HM23]WQQ27692.1 glycerophosphodiester phosphodiesterase [Nocardioides sp. HM61]
MTSRFHPLPKRALLVASALTALALAPVVSTADAAPVDKLGARSAPTARTVAQYDEPLVFAHRGASGYRPEHTLAAYQLAVEQGADYIEPDLVSTKDGVLVARHENEISGTTDVADHPEFADRKTTKTIDGNQVTGWFTEDFTLAELKTLRAKERLPQVRPGNTTYDGLYEVPTLKQVLRLVDRLEDRTGRTIGVAPELKHSTYFDSIGLSMEVPLVETLEDFGLDEDDSAVAIQSFEVTNLKELNRMTDAPLVQLLDAAGGPFDLKPQGVTYASMLTKKGIKRIATYADWLSPNKNWVLPRDAATGATGEPSNVVALAHKAGLPVVIWTLRAENQFMATNFRIGTDPNAYGDLAAEITAFLDAGVDALFTDHPDLGVAARDVWVG